MQTKKRIRLMLALMVLSIGIAGCKKEAAQTTEAAPAEAAPAAAQPEAPAAK